MKQSSSGKLILKNFIYLSELEMILKQCFLNKNILKGKTVTMEELYSKLSTPKWG